MRARHAYALGGRRAPTCVPRGKGTKKRPQRTALPRKNCNFAGCAPPSPLSEQRHIVEILDGFDTLTNSIKLGTAERERLASQAI